MDRRTFVAITGGALLGLSPNLRAQGQVKTRHIGFLSVFPRADVESFLGLLRPELEKLGWSDGRNIVLLEPRTTEGENDRLPSVASEVVSQGPDLILVQTVPATRALMQATKSIPIVMIGVGKLPGKGPRMRARQVRGGVGDRRQWQFWSCLVRSQVRSEVRSEIRTLVSCFVNK